MRHISIEVGTDGFATLTMDNADESVNLVSESWLAEMNETIASLTANEAVKGVIITSGKRSEEHTSELQSLMRISYAVFCLKKKNKTTKHTQSRTHNQSTI